MPHHSAPIATLLAAAFLTASVAAQCNPTWSPGGGPSGLNSGPLASIAWDPDGAGPAPEVLVVGGNFQWNGPSRGGVAWFDPTTGTWGSFGSGLLDPTSPGNLVRCFAVLPNGNLVAGGFFPRANGQVANSVAVWNGTNWAPLGTGPTPNGPGTVWSLQVLPNGNLVAGGELSTVGNLAVWNGTSWAPFAGGTDLPVTTLLQHANGSLYAGGFFTRAGTVTAATIAKWDGTQWSSLGSGVTGVVPLAMTTLANGDVAVGGLFNNGGNLMASILRWNHVAWSTLGIATSTVTPMSVNALATLANGDLMVGGQFSHVNGVPANHVARWDGTTWSAIGSGMSVANGSYDKVLTLTALANGDLAVGGWFSFVGNNLARWNSAGWSQFGNDWRSHNGTINALANLPNGEVVVGGRFTLLGNTQAYHIARSNGASWAPLGSGLSHSGSSFQTKARALLALPNGEIVVGGLFTHAGGVPAAYIAKWNGTAWSSMAGISGDVYALALLPNGQIVAGGNFTAANGTANNIAAWTGSAWIPLGSGFANPVYSLSVRPNGDLIAAGNITAYNYVARWNGLAWSAIGSTSHVGFGVLCALPNGDVISSLGTTASGNNLARWNGSTWTNFGAGHGVDRVQSLLPLPDGDLLVGGESINTTHTHANVIQRWTGAGWTDLNDGAATTSLESVYALLRRPNGTVLAGGGSTFAELVPTCPASATPAGNGCAGTAGVLQLRSAELPWLGGTCRTTCTNAAAGAFGFGLTGLATANTPLAQFDPTAGPNCMLLLSPLATELLVATNGSWNHQLAVPNDLGLVGVTIQQQVLQAEVGTLGALTNLSSSNRLQLVVGAF